jgi:hypothetical protein
MSLLSFISPWVFAAVGLLILIIFLVRNSNNINVLTFIKQNFFYFFVLLFLIIFAISVINIQTTYKINYSTLDGWKELFSVYATWLIGVFQNMARVTGYAVNQDWVAPQANSTLTK